jgi:hypothetical protein
MRRLTEQAKSTMPPIDCLPYRDARDEKAGGWRSFDYRDLIEKNIRAERTGYVPHKRAFISMSGFSHKSKHLLVVFNQRKG